MADEKNNLPDSNSEEKKNTGKKKPDKIRLCVILRGRSENQNCLKPDCCTLYCDERANTS